MLVFTQVLILFLIIGIGVITRRLKITTDAVNKGISELILGVTLPFLIIISFQMDFSSDLILNAGVVFVVSLFIHILAIFLGKFIFRVKQESKKKVLKFSIVFSNSAFMGFPVMDSLFGNIGVFYASIFIILFNIFIWTYGVMLFSDSSQKIQVKNVLINPGTVSVFIGLILFSFSIKLPQALHSTLSMVGNTTTPLAMIVVGSRLADAKISEVFTDIYIYFMAFIRLIFLPILVYFLLSLFPIDPIVMKVCVLSTAMPVAANTSIFAEKYAVDPGFASKCVFVSTMLSLLTIPLIHTFITL